ncbi:hypothetical protein IST4130_02963 [Burkholderia cenocepacia]|nr:hypothetical protein IST4130_02963 [Burkholderia cenocepacia]
MIPYSFATFSAVIPMWYWLYTSHSPSTIIVSTSFASPIRNPSREPGSTCGDALMFSWPPAITISASPATIAFAASITAFRPEPHTLLIVIPGTAFGSPALISDCRAGFCPEPAVSTWPMITSLTCSGFTPARSSTARITVAPSSGAAIFASEPPNLPTAVRAADTITTSVMFNSCIEISSSL